MYCIASIQRKHVPNPCIALPQYKENMFQIHVLHCLNTKKTCSKSMYCIASIQRKHDPNPCIALPQYKENMFQIHVLHCLNTKKTCSKSMYCTAVTVKSSGKSSARSISSLFFPSITSREKVL